MAFEESVKVMDESAMKHAYEYAKSLPYLPENDFLGEHIDKEPTKISISITSRASENEAGVFEEDNAALQNWMEFWVANSKEA